MQNILMIIFLIFYTTINSCSQVSSYKKDLENTLNLALEDINLTINELPTFSSDMLNKKISFAELIDSVNSKKYFQNIKDNKNICNVNIHIIGTPPNTLISMDGDFISYSNTTLLIKNFNFKINNEYLTILSLIEDSEDVNQPLSLEFEVRKSINNTILKGYVVLPTFNNNEGGKNQEDYIVDYLTDYFDNL